MSFTNPDKAKLYVRSYLEGRKFFKALLAMQICLAKHNGFRKDGATPEWFHQVSIVMYLITLEDTLVRYTGEDQVELFYIVAFLHDVVEDNDYPIESVEVSFGKDVADAVALISKKGIYANNFKKSTADYYAAMANNCLASIVKGCDRVHNLQTMTGVFTFEKQAAYMAECEDFILPMLKVARNIFPEVKAAYENIKHMMRMQIMLISEVVNACTKEIQGS